VGWGWRRNSTWVVVGNVLSTRKNDEKDKTESTLGRKGWINRTWNSSRRILWPKNYGKIRGHGPEALLSPRSVPINGTGPKATG